MGKKYENRKFDQKSENLKSDKIWIFWSNVFHGPQNLPKPPIDLKIVPICSGWSLVNLLVYGQLFSALNCPIAMLLDLRWNPPPPNLWRRKKTPTFLGLTFRLNVTLYWLLRKYEALYLQKFVIPWISVRCRIWTFLMSVFIVPQFFDILKKLTF